MPQRFRRMAKFVSYATTCLALGTSFVQHASAQRLPDTVRPEHYRLILTPDLKTATFTGSEKIDVQIEKPVDAITLNAIEIKFQSVKATLNGKTLEAAVTEDPTKEQATFNFHQQLPSGKLTLEIEYTGILNSKLRGFYLSKTEKRNYAVTQFESTDARRAFPSFDEPAFKATYDVTLIVDKGDTAISNGPIISDKPGPGAAKHPVTFATTAKMSSYLVALAVGHFESVEGEADGIPIRVWGPPGTRQNDGYALGVSEWCM